MKKKLLALSIGAALTAATVPAMSAELKISGRAHMSVDHLDNSAASDMNVSSNSSRLRISGNKEVVEGLTVMMQIESAINFHSGTSTLTGRDTFAGLKGDFGTVRLGEFDTPLKKVRSRTDMFGDRVGDARNITRNGGVKFDERFKNSVHYQTPNFNGLTFDIQYSAHNQNVGDRTTANMDKGENALSTAISYSGNGLFATVAYESQSNRARKVAGGSFTDLEAVRVGLTYDVVKGFRVAGFYQNADSASSNITTGKRTTYGVGAYYDLNSEYRLRGQFYTADSNDVKNSGANLTAFGIDRRFGRDLTLYGMYAMVDNEKSANFPIATEGRETSLISVAGKNQSAFSVGLIYNF